jgi:hypothetical protein
LAALIYMAARTTRDLTDFAVYHTAAERARSAAPLYRPDDGHFQFKYLPAFAVILTPLGYLAPEAAKVAWFAATFALLVVFIRQSIRAVPDRRAADAWLAWMAVLVMGRFAIRELTLGQANLLLATLAMSALAALRSARPALAGLALGAAVFVKPYALILLPVAVWSGRARSTVAFALVVAAGLAAPALLYGWDGNLALLHEWFRTVSETTEPNLLRPENVSLASTWAKWIGQSSTAAALAAASGIAVLAGVAIIAWRGRGGGAPVLELGLLLAAVPLLSPQGWDYMLLLALPVVLVTLDRWRETPRTWQVVLGTALILIALPLRELFGLDVYRQVMATGVVTIAALAVIASASRLRAAGLA